MPLPGFQDAHSHPLLGGFERIERDADGEPMWACQEPQMTELTIPFLGPERSTWQYPFADLVRHGGRLACGSDWPVSSPDPLWGVHVAVNRTAPAGYADARVVLTMVEGQPVHEAAGL